MKTWHLTKGKEVISVGKVCKNCGGDIKATRKAAGEARQTKLFCSRSCAMLWRSAQDPMKMVARIGSSFRTPEAIKKRIEGLRKSPNRMNCLRALRTKKSVKKSRKTCSKMPQFQSTTVHIRAKWWRVRDYRGVVHEFKNLCCFVRENPQLFIEDDLVGKTILHSKAYKGVASLRPSDRKKKPAGSWKSWTWYSQAERVHNDGHDLLNRIT
jgi:hypothetical protein